MPKLTYSFVKSAATSNGSSSSSGGCSGLVLAKTKNPLTGLSEGMLHSGGGSRI